MHTMFKKQVNRVLFSMLYGDELNLIYFFNALVNQTFAKKNIFRGIQTQDLKISIQSHNSILLLTNLT